MTAASTSPSKPSARLAAGVVAVALLAGLAGGAIGAQLRGGSPATAAASGSCDATVTSSAVLPSLVQVNVTAGGGGGQGSGSVVDASGVILTNDHVIDAAVGGGTITVDLARGQSGVPATIVGHDALTDIAVLRVQAGGLTAISVGRSADLLVGQPVVALGSPLGLTSTVTAGIVSALDRPVTMGSAAAPTILVGAVQTDASVNPGNSGGPLVDCAGRQVGVNSAGASPSLTGRGASAGLNFAIPMDFAMAEVRQILATGSVTHAAIGIVGTSVTAEVAKNTGLPRGVQVQRVVPGGPAASAGVQVGDVITAVGSTPVPTFSDYLAAIQSLAVGDTAHLAVWRLGQTISFSVPVVDGSTLLGDG